MVLSFGPLFRTSPPLPTYRQVQHRICVMCVTHVHNVGMSKRAQVLAVVTLATALIVLALLGVATVWLGPAGVYMLLGLGAALIARRMRRNV